MESVPQGEEDEGAALADVAVVHELEPLVDVGGGPVVGVNVEGLDQVTEPGGGLQPDELDVGAPLPVHPTVLAHTIKAEAGDDADPL